MIQNIFGIALTASLVLSSCTKETSSATGWEFNNFKNGGFEKFDAKEQEAGPGLVMIEGGTFTMGRTEQDVMSDWNARASRVTVASFYMDRTEVTNFNWLEYMYWMRRVYNKTYPQVKSQSIVRIVVTALTSVVLLVNGITRFMEKIDTSSLC
jgi:formylglycine-generating enzyme required for sulfatase activity